MSDMISRQTAISAICNARGKIDCDKMDKCEKLQLLPANSSEFPNNSDTISRQAAIDALDGELEITGRTNAEAVKGYVRLVKDRLERLPSAQPEQRWIPWDSERLPNDSGTYIVTAYDGAKERVTFAMYQKRLKRWELTGARAYWRVIAWMPLPEPYQEGEQDENR